MFVVGITLTSPGANIKEHTCIGRLPRHELLQIGNPGLIKALQQSVKGHLGNFSETYFHTEDHTQCRHRRKYVFLHTVGGAAHRCSQTPPLTCSMPARDDAAADGWQPPCSSPMLSPPTGAERPAALASTPQSAAASALPAAPGASARRATRASKATSISRPAAARACSRSPRTLKTTSVCGGG